jgi:Putative Ig domain
MRNWAVSFFELFLRHLACALFVLFAANAMLPDSAYAAQAGATPELTVQTASSSLARAFLHVPYRAQLEAQNGTTPYKWGVSSGSLPKGFNLSADGVLEGVPEEAGEFHFVVTVTDSAKPPQQRNQELILRVLAPMLAKWGHYPVVNGRRIEGSLKVTNQTEDGFDLTVIVVAVNENGRATALGYQHFTLEKNTLEKEIPFGETLPTGSYQVNADVVGEVAAINRIYRARLVSGERLPVVQQP